MIPNLCSLPPTGLSLLENKMLEDPISTYSDMGRITGKHWMRITPSRVNHLYSPDGHLGIGGLGSVRLPSLTFMT
jgi:hypothetical protein